MNGIKEIILNKVKSIHRWVFCRKELYKLNWHIYKIALHGIGVLNYENKSISGERYFINHVLSGIKEPVVLDIGANIGEYSKDISNRYPKAELFAFEPHPSNFNKLKRELNSVRGSEVKKACGKESGKVTLYDYDDEGTTHASTVEGVIEDIHKKEKKELRVSVTTVDDFVEKERLENVDLLKIDTEGNEIDVLKGARKTINSESIRCIQFEFNEMNVKSRTFARDFVEILENYKLFRMLPNGLVELGSYSAKEYEIFAYQNIVAVHEDQKDIINNIT